MEAGGKWKRLKMQQTNDRWYTLLEHVRLKASAGSSELRVQGLELLRSVVLQPSNSCNLTRAINGGAYKMVTDHSKWTNRITGTKR